MHIEKQGIQPTIDLLEKLISFRTVSLESNLELLDFIKNYLNSFDVACQFIYNEDRTRANLLACIGPSNSNSPGIILSGHTDVVPTTGQPWTKSDFLLTRESGRLYGRGTADMKGFIAAVLGAVPYWKTLDLQRPIYLAFSYDEEVGCLGVRSLLDVVAQLPVQPLACIIGEPTELQPVYGHKGKIALRCTITGFSAHSAYPNKGINAIEYAVDLIGKIKLVARDLQVAEKLNTRFSPPWSSIQVGLIKGGQAINIVPEECVFDFEIRVLPGVDTKKIVQEIKDYAENYLVPRMKAISNQCDITFNELSSYPALETSHNCFISQLIQKLSGISSDATVPYGTEGGLFSEKNIDSIVYGPGSMDQGHKPDEYIEISQLESCHHFLKDLGDWIATK